MERLYFQEVFNIVSCGIEVFKELGYGFSEVVYKDALECEFISQKIPYIREPLLVIRYKGNILKRKYEADFIVYDSIILEVKSGEAGTIFTTYPQILNYLKACSFRLGLIMNFGKSKMEHKRVIM